MGFEGRAVLLQRLRHLGLLLLLIVTPFTSVQWLVLFVCRGNSFFFDSFENSVRSKRIDSKLYVPDCTSTSFNSKSKWLRLDKINDFHFGFRIPKFQSDFIWQSCLLLMYTDFLCLRTEKKFKSIFNHSAIHFSPQYLHAPVWREFDAAATYRKSDFQPFSFVVKPCEALSLNSYSMKEFEQ